MPPSGDLPGWANPVVATQYPNWRSVLRALAAKSRPALAMFSTRGALPSGHPEWPYSAGYARHRAEAAIMTRLHQGVPAFPFCGKDGPYLNAVQVGLLA